VGAAESDLAARLVILANSRQPQSVALAHYYAEHRGVPAANIIALPLPADETVNWRTFVDEVWQPFQDELYRRGWIEGTASSLLDRFGRRRYAFASQNISYLVTCRGVPLRVSNDPALVAADSKFGAQFNRNESAVDAEFSLLATGNYDITGVLNNPLYAQEGRLSLDAAQVIKVTRLDGPTWTDARRLVDSALEGEKRGLAGRYYVDLQGPDGSGDEWLRAVQRQLDALGFEGDVEDTAATMTAAARCDAPLFYFGWYAGQIDGPFAPQCFAFVPGAIALHIHSFSAQTLHSDTAGWCGPLVARGVAATVGNVFEPYLQLTHRPDMLLRALARGRNFGDAAYYALPVLSWQAIAIGDPLYQPFRVTLDRQLAHLDQMPPTLARHAIVRQANLHMKQGQREAALAVLVAAQQKHPDLVVGLALAEARLAAGNVADASEALAFARTLPQFAASDWAAARAAAQFLVAHSEAPGAAAVYATLARSTAPNAEAEAAMLAEAEAAAHAAKEPELASEFSQRHTELTAVPPRRP
jgi:uncharacterized protein (TIGR03790 family)